MSEPLPPNVSERLVSIEQAVLFLEHQHDQLNEVVQELRAGLLRLSDRLDHLERQPPEAEIRDPMAERPPHY